MARYLENGFTLQADNGTDNSSNHILNIHVNYFNCDKVTICRNIV